MPRHPSPHGEDELDVQIVPPNGLANEEMGWSENTVANGNGFENEEIGSDSSTEPESRKEGSTRGMEDAAANEGVMSKTEL